MILALSIPSDDYYELRWETGKVGQCILTAIVQTERGPRKTELAEIPAALWRAFSERVVTGTYRRDG